MACQNPLNAFRAATEYLGPDLFRRASFNGLMINLISRGTFTQNQGLTHSVFTIGNQEPTSVDRPGTAVTLVNGSNSGSCAYDFTSVNWGYTENTYSPVKLQWRGPLVCKDDQYFNHMPAQFLNEYVTQLGRYVQNDLENHLQYYYMRRVPIYIARSAFDTPVDAVGDSATTFTAPQATSELTQQMLDTLSTILVQNRALMPDQNGFITLGEEGPLWSLGIHPQASQLIAQNNAEFRDDIRWAQSGQNNQSDLMKRLGANRTIKNFRHVPFILPPRFTYSGGAYTRVPDRISVNTSKGTTTVVNPAWSSPAAAPYEGALVLSPNVMSSDIVAPQSTVGPVSFNPTNYMGEWQWVTGPQALADTSGDACYDPLGKFGRHFAEYIHALKPLSNPLSGALIIYKRCAADYDLVQCT